jgi:hypothetical protein
VFLIGGQRAVTASEEQDCLPPAFVVESAPQPNHFLLGDPTAGSVKAGMEADSSDARDTPSSSVDTRQPWESERPKDRPVLSPDSLNSTDQSSGWVSLPRTYPGAW